MNTRSPLIDANHICHQFGQKTVLQDVSLTLHPNEIITLIGPNGAGKSTLLKILLGLLKPTSGSLHRKPGLRLGYMPQKIQVDASLPLTVKRFLQLGLPNDTNDTIQLDKVINDLSLSTLLDHPLQQVSGGEMQRLLLARSLLRSPELLVLDEPVQGVDLQGQTELYQYIETIRKTYGCGILMVSHDLHIVMKNTHQVLCLNQHICCSGHPHTVSENPAFKALFGDGFEEVAVYEHHHDTTACQHSHGTDSTRPPTP
ncbi:MAG: ATP-binding cassette domain-containing protein [Hydrogenovibrio sp.]